MVKKFHYLSYKKLNSHFLDHIPSKIPHRTPWSTPRFGSPGSTPFYDPNVRGGEINTLLEHLLLITSFMSYKLNNTIHLTQKD